MGFRPAQQSNEQTDQAADRSTAHSPATESATQQSTPDPSMMGQIWPSIERAEEHFGMRIPDESTLQRLEDHERAYGRETHEWIAEGMPTDIMGSPKSMEAFRQRQAERPPEVPTNIERQNRRSVLRSEKAVGNTSTAGGAGVPDPVRDVISSTGRSLDGSIQRAMEDRMGDSFGDVRIHTGSAAAEACESINARAFTVGNHIAFNSGEYDPSSPEGQHVLAHELAHVRQQTQGAVSMLPQENMELEVDPDPALEREAEEAAQQAMADGPVVVNRMGCEMQIQRADKSWNAGPSVSEQLYAEDKHDLEGLGIDPDDLDIDAESLGDRVIDGLKEGGLRSVLAGTIAASAAIASGGMPAIAGAAAGASALATTTAANAAFGEDSGVSEEVVAEMSGAVAKSEAFAEQAAENDQLAENLASNETLLSNLASKLDGLIGDGSNKTEF